MTIRKLWSYVVGVLFVTMLPAHAQVRFYIDGGNEAKTVEFGKANELTAKMKIAKAKRSKRFDQVDIAIALEGNTGVHDVKVEDKHNAFLKRFKGDELTVSIVPASGQTGTLAWPTGKSLTFADLIGSAQQDEMTQTKIKLTVWGWNVTGYKTKKVWREGERAWVEEKEPTWTHTVLAEGTFEITNLPQLDLTAGKSKEMLYNLALASFGSYDYKKALVYAQGAIKAGSVDAHKVATQAACRLKDQSLAEEHWKQTPSYYKEVVKSDCKAAGVTLP